MDEISIVGLRVRQYGRRATAIVERFVVDEYASRRTFLCRNKSGRIDEIEEYEIVIVDMDAYNLRVAEHNNSLRSVNRSGASDE